MDTRAADVFTRASRAACAGRGAVPCAAAVMGGGEALLPWESSAVRVRARARERTEIKCRARRTERERENHRHAAPQLHSTGGPLVAVSGARSRRKALVATSIV